MLRAFEGRNQISIQNTGGMMKELRGDITLTGLSLNQKAIQVQDAKDQYEELRKVHQAREAQLSAYTDRELC
jgi:hypothetical protein